MSDRAEDQIIHYLKGEIGLAEANKLVAQLKAETLTDAGFDNPRALRNRIDDLYYGPKNSADRTTEK